MTGYVDIIKTDIVSSDWDVFWEDISAVIPNPVASAEVLVIANAASDNDRLMKMMEVCKLMPGTYNLLKLTTEQKVAWHQLRDTLNPKVLFLIDVTPAQLGVSAMFFQHEPNSFNDRTWLITVSVAEIDQNPELKKFLWSSGMKPIFVDKTVGELS